MIVFKEARLKIKRANTHIADVKERISSLPDSYVASIEKHPTGGYEVIKHDLSDPECLTDIAIMVGDAVHNLKCALDYAWHQTMIRFAPAAISRFSKFPVYETVDKLETAL